MIAPGGYLVSPVLVGMDEASYRDKMTFLRENTKLAKPKPSNSSVEGSGTAAGFATVMEKFVSAKSSKVAPSRPPKMEKVLRSYVPIGVFEASKISNNSKGTVLAPGARESGALAKNGVSSMVRKGDGIDEASPFRKIVSVLEGLEIVASKTTVVVPRRTVWLACERVTSSESARAAFGHIAARSSPANARIGFFRFMIASQ